MNYQLILLTADANPATGIDWSMPLIITGAALGVLILMGILSKVLKKKK